MLSKCIYGEYGVKVYFEIMTWKWRVYGAANQDMKMSSSTKFTDDGRLPIMVAFQR